MSCPDCCEYGCCCVSCEEDYYEEISCYHEFVWMLDAWYCDFCGELM